MSKSVSHEKQSPVNIPWLCAVAIAAAMTLGLLADGIADGVAAVMLLVPSVIVFRRLLQRA